MATAGAAQPLVWSPLHEPSTGGWITSVAVSPHDRSRVLIGGDILGIALSLNRGDSWLGTYGLRCWEIADFTWHPTDSNTVWVGTLGGPYQSTDAGRNWTSRRAGMPVVSQWVWSVPIQRILFDPNNSVRLLAFGGNHHGYSAPASEYGGVYESTNSGSTWRRLGTVQAGSNIVEAAFAAGSSTRLYAAVKYYGVCVSENGGANWQLRTNGLPSAKVKDLAAHPTDPLTAYVVMSNNRLSTGQYEAGGVWMTTNGGTNWVERNNGLRRNTGTDGNYVAKYESIAIHPHDPNRLLTSDTAYDNPGAYVSVDGGQAWTKYSTRAVAMPSGANLTGLAFDSAEADTMFGFGAEYVLRSTNGGHTWQDISSMVVEGQPGYRGRGYAGWVTTQFRWHPTDPQRSIFTGLDHGFGWQSRNGLLTWTRGSGLPTWGGATDAAWAPNDVLYLTCGQEGVNGAIARSLNGGTNFTQLKGSALGLPDSGFPRSVYPRPDVPGEVWVCWNGLRRSTDHGASWSSVPVSGNPRWIAGDPNDPQRIYACSSEGVSQCINGATFQLMAGSPLQGTRLTVDTAGRVLVVNWRQSGGGLYRFATNRWTKIRADPYVRAVAVDPGNPQRLMVATSDDPYHDETFATGVWTSEDDGRTWQQQNLGLPHPKGMCVSVSPHDPDLWVVGTGGRGFFITRWADLSIRREGVSVPPQWRILGTPNLKAVLEHSADLLEWHPVATNALPMDGWIFGPGAESLDFFRAKVTW
ncbi:MAG: hypothetical protein IH623_31655 [Verrucomicrobia bacterium]|nr:hypothetical protein [Verrucomicrobiota bacterium]